MSENVDAEIAAALAEFPLDLGALSREGLPSLRAAMAKQPAPELSDQVERTDHEVPSGDGEPPVTVRVHRPKSANAALGALYFMHGGGLVLGSYTGEDLRFDRWCQLLDIVGVSVEYRLAPETPFPGPVDDCYRGLAWLHANATELGVDPARIGIGGASAGGGLAAALALMARDRGEIPVAYQLLIYPMLDDRQTTTSSAWEVPIWPPRANTFGWNAYLGDAKGSDGVSEYAAAARATDLAGLPPALISVGGADGFVDEDLDYATRLNQAGVATELHVYPDAPHGFDGLAPQSKLAQRAKLDMEDWLQRQVHGD